MGVIVMSEKERVRLEVLGWKERVGVSLVKAAEAMWGKLSSGEEYLEEVQGE
jgi:hypothetical protein